VRTYRFGDDTEFDELTGEVRRGHTITRLEPQPALVLALLARRAGELVSHDEIRRAVWGEDTHVDFQDGMHYCIARIRAALGDRPRQPRVIVTVPKRGYRLHTDALSSTDARPAEGWQRRLAIAAVIVAVGTATALLERRPNNHHEAARAVLREVHDLIY
jgi:DNA-binding winged helix-turn-helix (wHTH) protein